MFFLTSWIRSESSHQLLIRLIIVPEHGFVHISAGMTLDFSYFGRKRPFSNYSCRKQTGISACLRVKFNVSDETGTLFNCTLVYLKRGKRLNPLTHWDIHVSGGEVAPSFPEFHGLWLPRASHITPKLELCHSSTSSTP